MARYVQIDKRAPIKSGGDKLRRFLARTFNGELFVGLWVVLKNMFKRGGSHTLRYPMEKFVMPPRYRGVHKLMRLLESGSERCIGCGLCEKICVANCIAMETSLGSDGRKKVDNYQEFTLKSSINQVNTPAPAPTAQSSSEIAEPVAEPAPEAQ